MLVPSMTADRVISASDCDTSLIYYNNSNNVSIAPTTARDAHLTEVPAIGEGLGMSAADSDRADKDKAQAGGVTTNDAMAQAQVQDRSSLSLARFGI